MYRDSGSIDEITRGVTYASKHYITVYCYWVNINCRKCYFHAFGEAATSITLIVQHRLQMFYWLLWQSYVFINLTFSDVFGMWTVLTKYWRHRHSLYRYIFHDYDNAPFISKSCWLCGLVEVVVFPCRLM